MVTTSETSRLKTTLDNGLAFLRVVAPYRGIPFGASPMKVTGGGSPSFPSSETSRAFPQDFLHAKWMLHIQ